MPIVEPNLISIFVDMCGVVLHDVYRADCRERNLSSFGTGWVDVASSSEMELRFRYLLS